MGRRNHRRSRSAEQSFGQLDPPDRRLNIILSLFAATDPVLNPGHGFALAAQSQEQQPFNSLTASRPLQGFNNRSSKVSNHRSQSAATLCDPPIATASPDANAPLIERSVAGSGGINSSTRDPASTAQRLQPVQGSDGRRPVGWTSPRTLLVSPELPFGIQGRRPPLVAPGQVARWLPHDRQSHRAARHPSVREN